MPVIVHHAIRRVGRAVSDNSLQVFGEPRIVGNSNPALLAAANDISLDIPQGPLPGTYWILEYIAALLADPTGAGGPDLILSGFCVVPINQSPITDPANTGTAVADLPNRGIFLLPTAATEFAGGAITYLTMSLVGLKIVIPYGYTIRAVATSTYDAATPFGIGTVMSMGGLVRVISSCNPCPPAPQVPL